MLNEESLVRAGKKLKSISYVLCINLLASVFFIFISLENSLDTSIIIIFIAILLILWIKLIVDIYKAGYFLVESCENESFSGPQTFNEMLRNQQDESGN